MCKGQARARRRAAESLLVVCDLRLMKHATTCESHEEDALSIEQVVGGWRPGRDTYMVACELTCIDTTELTDITATDVHPALLM